MTIFLRLVAQLTTKAAKWAWTHKETVLSMIKNGVRIDAIIRYIESKV
ncbi:aureocin A53 family class IId bacteriocin [Exiguobacterium sp. s191]|nr:aureocin A53 family class IId bacteriocin [Exiguobacterium sp. s191]